MVEPYTTFAMPIELFERADRALDAASDVMVAGPRLGCTEYRRRLEQARREFAKAYLETCLYIAESGGPESLVSGLHLASEQLDKEAAKTWHCSACESSKGGDRG